MAPRTEKQGTVVIAEWRVVGIHGYGVGAGLLLREGDIILHAESLRIHTLLFIDHLLKKRQVVMRNREMDIGPAICAGIEGRLHKMFLHRSARPLVILVEKQQPLGQLPVVQALAFKQVGHDRLVAAPIHQSLHATALICQALGIQSLKESEMSDIREELLLKICSGPIIVCS